MSRPRILIAEDEAIVAMDLEKILLGLGYQVVERVSRGEDAVRAAAETIPNLVLMDIKLEGDLDGIDAAEKIKANLDIPLVYITSYATNELLDRAKATSPFGYLLKPFSEQQLRSVIEIALHNHSIECQLRDSERKFRSLYETAPLPYHALDDDNLIIDVNRAWLNLFGYSKKEVLGKWFGDLVVKGQLYSLKKYFQMLNGSNDSLKFELDMLRKDSSCVTVECSATRNPSENGIPERTHCILADITSRKKAEKILLEFSEELEKRIHERTKDLESLAEKLKREVAERTEMEQVLRESEQRFRNLFESARDCIFVKDMSLNYIMVNPYMINFFEAPISGIVGKRDDDLYGRTEAAHLREVDTRVLQGDTIEEEHTRIINGTPMTFLDTKSPMKNGRGEIVGIFGISHNITDRKKMRLLQPEVEIEYRISRHARHLCGGASGGSN